MSQVKCQCLKQIGYHEKCMSLVSISVIFFSLPLCGLQCRSVAGCNTFNHDGSQCFFYHVIPYFYPEVVKTQFINLKIRLGSYNHLAPKNVPFFQLISTKLHIAQLLNENERLGSTFGSDVNWNEVMNVFVIISEFRHTIVTIQFERPNFDPPWIC